MNHYFLVLVVAVISFAAQAAPIEFKNCRSEIVTEVFVPCPGEGGAATPCGSQTTKHGTFAADLIVDSPAKSASVLVTYSPVTGQPKQMATDCVLGSDSWMSCTTAEPIAKLGKLIVSFHIEGINPGVYFADIFADASNVPVGGFQTAMDCQNK